MQTYELGKENLCIFVFQPTYVSPPLKHMLFMNNKKQNPKTGIEIIKSITVRLKW